MEFDVKIEKEQKQFCEANKKQLKLLWDQWRLRSSEALVFYYRHWRSTETKRDVQTIFAFSQKNAENENANFP